MIIVRHGVLLLFLMAFGSCAVKPLQSHDCPGANPGVVPININYNAPTIVVAPPNQDADQGDVLQFNLIGANKVLVSTSGKTPDAGWLNGSGKKKMDGTNNKFFICVPTDLFDGLPETVKEKEFGYDVNAVGHPQLDPVVTVNRY